MSAGRKSLLSILDDSAREGLLNHLLAFDGFTSKPVASDPFPGVLEHLKSSIARTVQLNASVRRLALAGKGVVAGMDDGSVAYVTAEAEVDILGKHRKSVRCVCRAGDLVATGSADATVKVWDMVQLTELATLSGHSDWVRCLLMTATHLISGSDDTTMRVWTLEDFKDCCTLRGHEGAISALLLSPDGSLLVSSSYDSSVRIWQVATWEAVVTLSGHSLPVTCIAFTPGGDYLISGSEDTSIIVWQWSSKTQLACLQSHSQAVLCLAVSADGKRLLSGAGDQSVKVWSLEDFGEVGSIVGHSKDVEFVALTNDGKYIWSAGSDSFIRVWSATDFCEIASLKGHSDSIYSFLLLADGRHAVSGSKDGSLKVWDFADESETRQVGKQQAAITAIGLSNNGQHVVTGGADGVMKVWDITAMTDVGSLSAHTDEITDLIIMHDGLTVFSSSCDSTIKAWSLSSMTELATLRGHSSAVRKLGLTNQSDLLISLSADASVKLWELDEFREKTTLIGHNAAVSCFCLPGSSLVTGSGDGVLKAWSLSTFTELSSISAHSAGVSALVVATGCFASAAEDGEVKVWDSTDFTEKRTLTGHSRVVRALHYLREEDWLVSAAEDELVRVWDLKDGLDVAVLTGHSDAITCSSLVEKFIITGSSDCSLKVWSLSDMHELATYAAHPKPVTVLKATPFSHYIVSGAADGSVYCTALARKVAGLRVWPKLPVEGEIDGVNSIMSAAVEKVKNGAILHREIAGNPVLPYYFNALHVCAYYSHAQPLAEYLRMGVPIIRGTFGSALTVALKRNTIKCIKVILEHLITLCETPAGWIAIQEITEDLPILLVGNTPQLEAFFALLLRPSSQQRLPQFIIPKEELPIVSLNPSWFIQTRAFEDVDSGQPQEVVEFLVSTFRWNFAIGSSDSLEFLNALEACKDRGVLTTPIVDSLIVSKWEKLMPVTVSLTVMYTFLLLSMMGIVFHYGDHTLSRASFLIINGLFLLYEIVQSIVSGLEYWKDPWNYLDWVRSTMCVLWVLFFEGQRYIELSAVCMCFFRGFTYFRTFKMTRMFVRLTLEVVKEMYTFLIIVAYSTIAFGMMYAVLVPDVIDSAFKAWMTAYELLMGTYTTDGFTGLQWLSFTSSSLVNVIIMLNLLIAILSDAYEQAQLSAQQNDTLEMLRIVIEYESMIFWRRNSGSPSVLVKCWALNTTRTQGEWQGKVNQITKSVREELKRGEAKSESRFQSHRRSLEAAEGRIAAVDSKFTALNGIWMKLDRRSRELEAAAQLRLAAVEHSVGKRVEAMEGKLKAALTALRSSR